MEVELVYYRMCNKETFYNHIEKAEFNYKARLKTPKDLLCDVSIKENNIFFLEELENVIIPNGYSKVDYWLRGLLSDYVKRRSRQNNDSPYFFSYYESWFNNTRLVIGNKYPVISKWCDDYEEEIKNSQYMKEIDNSISYNSNDKIFIVHGRNNLMADSIARFIENIGLKPIILHEQPDMGQTIIEKINKNTDVGYAIILYTPCDLGKLNDENNEYKPRARQNVIFEHGYLIAKLGIKRTCPLVSDRSIELPSDISGVIYTEITDGTSWKYKLAKEMKAVGYNIDMNNIK